MTGTRSIGMKMRLAGQIYLYLGVMMVLAMISLNYIWDPKAQALILGFGLFGAWRWGWWLVHIIRSIIYLRITYPGMAHRARQAWSRGWRPDEVVYMMTTYKEDQEITHRVVQSIIDETLSTGLSARLFVGTGDPYDEEVIGRYFESLATVPPIEVVFVRQKGTGKRMAIGTVLREMARRGIGDDTPVVFMDGDTVLEPGCLKACLGQFAINPRLQALTTNEQAIVWGPDWMQKWLDMRFGQRHLGMCSHALSKKVITLTGRMSVFRGANVVHPEFYTLVESDNLTHWLWGNFRFLSGDDKSTWYWLLRRGAEMTYVPDAMATTIEIVDGNGIDRMKANLLRWSGNMLRNGSRAIALGPRKVNPFIWWCLVDQRISIWTVLVGPAATIIAMIFVTPMALLVYILWIMGTRLVASMVIGIYGGKYDISYPFILYASQILNSVLKVYIWFRLPRQRWANRGNQALTQNQSKLLIFRNWMAFYLTTLAVAGFVYMISLYLGVFDYLGWDRAWRTLLF